MFIPPSRRDILGLLIERCTTACYHLVGLNHSLNSWHTFPHKSGRWIWRQKTHTPGHCCLCMSSYSSETSSPASYTKSSCSLEHFTDSIQEKLRRKAFLICIQDAYRICISYVISYTGSIFSNM